MLLLEGDHIQWACQHFRIALHTRGSAVNANDGCKSLPYDTNTVNSCPIFFFLKVYGKLTGANEVFGKSTGAIAPVTPALTEPLIK